jgi:hypothetical protein
MLSDPRLPNYCGSQAEQKLGLALSRDYWRPTRFATDVSGQVDTANGVLRTCARLPSRLSAERARLAASRSAAAVAARRARTVAQSAPSRFDQAIRKLAPSLTCGGASRPQRHRRNCARWRAKHWAIPNDCLLKEERRMHQPNRSQAFKYTIWICRPPRILSLCNATKCTSLWSNEYGTQQKCAFERPADQTTA